MLFCTLFRIYMYHSYKEVTIVNEGLKQLSAGVCTDHHSLWARRDLYSAIFAKTRGLGFYGLIRRTAHFSCLLQRARRHMYWRHFWPWSLWDPVPNRVLKPCLQSKLTSSWYKIYNLPSTQTSSNPHNWFVNKQPTYRKKEH